MSMSSQRSTISPLLIQAFGLLQVDPVPIVDRLRQVRPTGWVRFHEIAPAVPVIDGVEVVAMRLRNGSYDIEVGTSWSRMMSDGDVVSIVAETCPDVMAVAMIGKPLSKVAATKLLLHKDNVVLSATVLEFPPRLVLSVRALAVDFKTA
jgi:hypothetical protein